MPETKAEKKAIEMNWLTARAEKWKEAVQLGGIIVALGGLGLITWQAFTASSQLTAAKGQLEAARGSLQRANDQQASAAAQAIDNQLLSLDRDLVAHPD